MAVHIELSPFLRHFVPGYNPEEGLVIENGAGRTVGELMEDFGIPENKVNSVMVNRRPSDSDYVVKDGDQIALSLAIGGG